MSPTVTLKDKLLDFFDKYFSYIKGKSVENPNMTKSLILHFFILFAVSGMLPTCSRKIEKPRVIAVDIMPIGEAKTNTPPAPQVAKPEPKKEEPKKVPPKPQPPKEVKKPVEAVKMEKAEKPKPVAKPVEKPSVKKVEKKPEPEKKKQEEQKKKDEKDQEGKKKLLKDLEKKEQAQLEDIFEAAAKPDAKPASQAQASGKSDVVDPALVDKIMGAIQAKVQQNWNIPIGVKDVQNINVPLYIKLDRAANVIEVKIVEQARYSMDNSYRVLADSAVWAVKESSPFSDLPMDKYDTWNELELSFDPKDVL